MHFRIFSKIIIDGFVTSLQYLFLWGLKYSSQNFREKKWEIYNWNTEIFILQNVLCLCSIVSFIFIITQNIIGSKGKKIPKYMEIYFDLKNTVFQSCMFDSLLWFFICYSLLKSQWEHLIITLIHKPNRKGRYYTFSGVLQYCGFP